VTPWIVVPIKDPLGAKARLAPALDPEARRQLATRLAERTLAVLAAVAAVPVVVVTRGLVVPAMARAHGFAALEETGDSHSAAARQGARWAADHGADVVAALSADLPLLAVADVQALLAAAGPGTAVLAPDRRGSGTNAVVAPPGFPFAFGAPSLARHMALARAAGLAVVIVHRPGLASDLDTPADLDLLETLAPTPGHG